MNSILSTFLVICLTGCIFCGPVYVNKGLELDLGTMGHDQGITLVDGHNLGYGDADLADAISHGDLGGGHGLDLGLEHGLGLGMSDIGITKNIQIPIILGLSKAFNLGGIGIKGGIQIPMTVGITKRVGLGTSGHGMTKSMG